MPIRPGYTGPALELKVSTDYNGSGNPNDFTWTDLSDQVSWPTGSTFFVWTNSGTIDISGFGNGNLYIAFVYFSTEENSSTWEIDDVRVYGEGEITIDPEPTDYPEGFEAAATGSSIKLTWTDATGEVPPDGYLIRASDQDNIELPQDGIPVENDPDLGDGSGAMNISQGIPSRTCSSKLPIISKYSPTPTRESSLISKQMVQRHLPQHKPALLRSLTFFTLPSMKVGKNGRVTTSLELKNGKE